VLKEIGAGEIPQMLVFNKIDRLEGAQPRHDVPGDGCERVWVSARDGSGVDLLRGVLAQKLGFRRVRGVIDLPAHSARLRSRLHALGAVLNEDHDEHGWHLTIDLALTDAQRLAAQPGGHLLEALLPEMVEE
jgi:GTP-binding protein HflX